MSQHNELQGNDLHEPSTRKILNATGSELQPGTWVFIGVDENDAGFIPVTNLATAGQRLIGLVEEVPIATNATGVVRTLGPSRADTSAFSAKQGLSLLTNTGTATYAVTTDASQNIAEVITVGTNGTINIDTVTTPVIANAASTLENLTDVTITNRADNDIIQFDATTSQWINVQDSGEGTIDDIEIGGTGIVTVTYNDGTPDLQFQAGHSILANDVEQTYRGKLNVRGNVNFVDDLANEETKLYTQAVEPAESNNDGEVQTIIDAGLGGEDNLQPVIQGRTLRNNDGNIDLTTSGSTDPAVADPFIDIDSLATTENTEKNAIQDVEIASNTVAIKDLVDRVGLNELSELDDVVIDNPMVGQALIDALRSASFNFELTDTSDSILVTFSRLDNNIVSSTGQPVINFLNLTVASSQSAASNDFTLTSGDTNLNIRMNFTQVSPTVDNIIDRFFISVNSTDTSANATNINWDRSSAGAGGFDRVIGSNTYSMTPNFTRVSNPTAVVGVRSSGSITFTDGRPTPGSVWDIGNIRIDVVDSLGHGHSVNISPNNLPSSLEEYIGEIVTIFNNSSILSAEYTASSLGGVFTVTAKEFGPRYDGLVSWQVFDNNEDPADDLIPSSSSFVLSGGIDPASSNRINWTNAPSTDEITRIGSSGPVDFEFNQGGHIYENQTLTVNSLSDVDVTSPVSEEVLQYDGTNWVNRTISEAGSLEDLTDVQITNRVDGQKIKFNAASGFWINVDDTIEELNDVSVNNLVADEVLVYDGGSWVNRFYNLFNLSDTNFANFNNVRPNGNGIIWDETGAADGSGAWVEKFIPTTSYFGIRTMPGTLDRIPSDANYGAEAQSAMFMVGEEVNDKYMDLIETTVSRSDSGVTIDFPVQYLRLQPGKYRFSGTYACTFVGTNSTHEGDVILQLRYGPNEADVRDSRIQQVENNGNENAVIHLKGAGADSLMESTNITINGLLRSAVAFEVVPTIIEFTKETYVSLFFHTNNVQSFSLANFFVEANPNNPLGLEITRLDNV